MLGLGLHVCLTRRPRYREAMPDPIAFLAALPSTSTALRVHGDGEALLTVAIPATEAHHVTGALPRLQGTAFYVTLVPQDVTTPEKATKARWQGRRK